MKSFLVRNKRPLIKWGRLPSNIFFEGKVPEGFSLAITPSKGYIVLDVDRHGTLDGFDFIPPHIKKELEESLNYKTKNNGKHYWLKYTGDKELPNKTSGKGIDLRTHNGYVVWYLKNDVRHHLDEIKETSLVLNNWIEDLFFFVPVKKKKINVNK